LLAAENKMKQEKGKGTGKLTRIQLAHHGRLIQGGKEDELKAKLNSIQPGKYHYLPTSRGIRIILSPQQPIKEMSEAHSPWASWCSCPGISSDGSSSGREGWRCDYPGCDLVPGEIMGCY
jgi:hypothetical protein